MPARQNLYSYEKQMPLSITVSFGILPCTSTKKSKGSFVRSTRPVESKSGFRIDSRNKKVSPDWNFHRYKSETDSRKHGICTVSHSLWRNSLYDTCNGYCVKLYPSWTELSLQVEKTSNQCIMATFLMKNWKK